MLGTDLARCLVAGLLHEPAFVVEFDGPVQFPAQLLQALKDPAMQDLLLEGPDEPLRHAVALRLAHEGSGALDPKERDFALEFLRDVVRAVVVPENELVRDTRAEAAHVSGNDHADRLQSLSGGCGEIGVVADELA